MQIKLPRHYRPRGNYRKLELGLDVPSSFYYDLKALDEDFHLIWHPYRTMWDSIINEHEGAIEEARYHIHNEFGQLVFGFCPKTNTNGPIPDNTWHIWRLCHPHGWAHIIKLECLDPLYLKAILTAIHNEKKFFSKYGYKSVSYGKHKLEQEDKEKARREKEERDMFESIQHENRWLIRRALENAQRGKFAATNPKKDIITSFGGQTNRTRIVRPITEKEAGIVGYGDN